MSALDPGETSVAELRRILEVHAPGCRVAAVGGGIGELDGFDVTALGESTVDAVVCLRWGDLGWAERRGLLQRARDVLSERGLLVIDHASTELLAFVLGAGFTVLRTEAVGIRLVAQVTPSVSRSLAVAHWGTPAGVLLDLRYAPDEDEWLRPRPREVWEALLPDAAELVSAYPVDDPYSGVRGAPVISGFFGIPIEPGQVTFGAGVTSLLHALSWLGGDGPVLAPALVHPDLAAWAVARGRAVRLVGEPATCDRIRDAIGTVRPTLLHLDRPDFAGDALSLDELRLLADTVSLAGGVVVVDEAAAPYLGPAASAARLVPEVGNLVVLRGFTKAYSWGGLRGGYALAGERVAGRVRDLVPPMQAGEIAVHAALRMLAAGDVFAGLRDRIRRVKPDFADALTAVGLQVITGHPDVPWVVVSDTGGAAFAMLERVGVKGLSPVPPPVVPSPPINLLHLTVPLSEERIALFRELIRET